MKVPGILKNKYVFYALAALAVLNVVGYVSVQAWECLALFSLTAYSAHCYCNNKACSILAALFVANFVFGCGRVKEGMEDMLASADTHVEKAKEHLESALEGFTADRSQCAKGDNSNKAASDFTDDPDSVPEAERKTAAQKAQMCVDALNSCTDCMEMNGNKTWQQQNSSN